MFKAKFYMHNTLYFIPKTGISNLFFKDNRGKTKLMNVCEA